MTKISYFILTIVALIAPLAARAEDSSNNSPFREDRVYNYFTGDALYNRYLVKMKFSGSTEIDGIKYQNLTNCYQGIIMNSSISSTQLDNDILVRKDDGKVYARIPNDYLGGNSLEIDAETGYSKEVMLYDFKCPVGESFASINEEGQKILMKVISEEQVEIGGETLRKIDVEWTYNPEASGAQNDNLEESDDSLTGDAEIIENIGFVSSSYGCFFAFVNTELASGAIKRGINSPNQMQGAHRSDLCFWKITDTNGNGLYSAFESNVPDPGFGLFRTDRVWGYESDGNHPGQNTYQFKMKFNGTEDYDGVTYHKFVNTECQEYVSDRQFHSVSPDETPILVREDNGKVYARLPKTDYRLNNLPFDDAEYSAEVMLYDFSCPVGETFTGLGYDSAITLKVIAEEYVNIGGENLRKMTVIDSPDDDREATGMEFEVIENIGVVSPMGFFTYFQNAICAAPAKNLPINSNRKLYFLAYSDTDGVALYKPDESENYSPCFTTINEDNVWEYFKFTAFVTKTQEVNRNTQCKIERYKFNGTQYIGQHYYHCLYKTEVSAWRVGRLETSISGDFYTDAYAVTDNESNEFVAYLREENGKIFMLLNRSQVECMDPPYVSTWTRDVENNEEVLLYDFNAWTGDVVQSFINDSTITALKVSRSERISVDGFGCVSPFALTGAEKERNTDSEPIYNINISTLEGVGNIGMGNFVDLGCEYNEQPTCVDITYSCFNNLYDKDGNVLYNGSNFSVPDTNSVDVIYENDSSCETAPMYDLMGRRITSPTKGQIYIQNGKKFVGQCSK